MGSSKTLIIFVHIKTPTLFTAIPKEQSIFEIQLEGYLIQIYGKHFIVRSKDRSKKKIKDNIILELWKFGYYKVIIDIMFSNYIKIECH